MTFKRVKPQQVSPFFITIFEGGNDKMENAQLVKDVKQGLDALIKLQKVLSEAYYDEGFGVMRRQPIITTMVDGIEYLHVNLSKLLSEYRRDQTGV